MPDFIPGLVLSEAFYREAIRPVLDARFPGLPHSAALLGYGSDVIGLDTATSRDHMWGPRAVLFLRMEDHAGLAARIHEALRFGLPPRFRGYSTHFGAPDAQDGGVRVSAVKESGPVDHLVRITTLERFWQAEIGVSPRADPAPADWLTFAEHKLLSLTAGKVFHDEIGLEAARARLRYYPEQVWRYLLAAQWALISQEEAFAGRTQQVGDEIGSRVIAARLVERVMRLCFLMERRYAPYSKWFGSAFRQLRAAERMAPLLEQALAAEYPTRAAGLAAAYRLAAEMHNALAITPPLETGTRTYSGWHLLRAGVTDLPPGDPRDTRPFPVIFADRFADAILESISDPLVRSWKPRLGSVNQFLVESSDALQSVAFTRALRQLIEGQEPSADTHGGPP